MNTHFSGYGLSRATPAARRDRWLALLFVGLLGWIPGLAQDPVPAFPGAIGFGKFALGARGGAKPDIYVVTSLADDGRTGTLRHGLSSVSGNNGRFIVFDVAGIIVLRDGKRLRIAHPYITIAGQTAPQGGICIMGEGIAVESHNIIIRGLRIRPADLHFARPAATTDRDAVKIGSGTSRQPEIHDVIVDHCSFSWTLDECISAYSACYNVTYQYNIIAESLHQSIHVDEGIPGPPYAADPHSTGQIFGPHAKNVSLYRNVSAHHMYRQPRLAGTTNVEVINNVFYNFGSEALDLAGAGGEPNPLHAHVIGNLWRSGPDSPRDRRRVIRFSSFKRGNDTRIFLDGNGVQCGADTLLPTEDPVARGFTRGATRSEAEAFLMTAPVFAGIESKDIVRLTATMNELDDLLETVGARWPMRDSIDNRIIASIRDRDGSIIDAVYISPGTNPDPTKYSTAVGRRVAPDVDETGDRKTPEYATLGSPRPDADKNGISDELEAILHKHPLLDDDGNGYLNIEDYLNGIDRPE